MNKEYYHHIVRAVFQGYLLNPAKKENGGYNKVEIGFQSYETWYQENQNSFTLENLIQHLTESLNNYQSPIQQYTLMSFVTSGWSSFRHEYLTPLIEFLNLKLQENAKKSSLVALLSHDPTTQEQLKAYLNENIQPVAILSPTIQTMDSLEEQITEQQDTIETLKHTIKELSSKLLVAETTLSNLEQKNEPLARDSQEALQKPLDKLNESEKKLEAAQKKPKITPENFEKEFMQAKNRIEQLEKYIRDNNPSELQEECQRLECQVEKYEKIMKEQQEQLDEWKNQSAEWEEQKKLFKETQEINSASYQDLTSKLQTKQEQLNELSQFLNQNREENEEESASFNFTSVGASLPTIPPSFTRFFESRTYNQPALQPRPWQSLQTITRRRNDTNKDNI